MDKPTHYVEIRVLPLDGDMLSSGDVALVTAKIMASIHLHIVDGHEIAVSFPKLCEKTVRDSKGFVAENVGTGDVIRVFGDAVSLMSLLIRQDFAFLIGAAACSLGKQALKEVPSNAQWEVYARERSTERQTRSYIERSGQRMARRIADGRSSKTADDVAERSRQLTSRIGGKLPPFVQMASSSTGKRFRLFIERSSVDGFVVATPSTYGLGVPVPKF